MASSSVSFPLALAKNLELLRDEIGLTQRELADSAGVAQGTYSNLIIGKAVRAKSARAIVAAIQRHVEQHVRRINASPQEQAALLRDVAWAIAVLEGGSDATVPQADADPQIDLGALERFSQLTPKPLKIHQPGGAVPSDATPYVKRAHDDLILETLGLPSVAMLVRGPSQCGKSTALALLERRLHETGIETAWFDPQPASSDPRPGIDSEAEGDAHAASALCELLQARWGLQQPRRGTINTIPKLNNWLLRELAPTASRPRLLIMDDLLALGGPAAERWLSLFVRNMVNQHATSSGVNILVAVGLTDHFGAYFERKLILISSIVEWEQKFELGWLTRDEVGELVRQLRDKQTTELSNTTTECDELFRMFRGQPYLTHAAAVHRSFREAVRQWLAEPSEDSAGSLRQLKWYRRHLSAIRLALCGPTHVPGSEARLLITALRQACRAPSTDPRPVSDYDHALFLKTAKLLDEDGRPSIELYRLIAEDLPGAQR